MKQHRLPQTEKNPDKKKRKCNKKRSLIISLAVGAFAVYAVATFINQQIQIGDKREELALLTQEIQVQTIKNNEIRKSLDSTANENSEYIERQARTGLDFVKPGERVFVNVAGN